MPWAHVENGVVTAVFDGNNGCTLGNVKHPRQIFGNAWSDKQRAEIGIFPLVMDGEIQSVFKKPNGKVHYRFDDGKVYGEREYNHVPIDQAKGRLSKDIAVYAERLIESYFSRDDRINAALKLLMMNSEELACEGSVVKADISRKMRYVDSILAEKRVKLAQVEGLANIDRVISYDWKDGWPFPEK